MIELKTSTTMYRRRPRNNDILSQKSVIGRKEIWVFMTLMLSCWTVQTTQAQSISLLNGRFTTTTDVTDYLNIAMDASKMIESEDFEVTLDIYKNVSMRVISYEIDRQG